MLVNCEKSHPVVLKEDGELIPVEDLENPDKVVEGFGFSKIECEPEGDPEEFISIIEGENAELKHREQITTGDFLVAGLLIILILIILAGGVFKRSLPDFMRWWK